jgi:deoxyhypusine monooxygenase
MGGELEGEGRESQGEVGYLAGFLFLFFFFSLYFLFLHYCYWGWKSDTNINYFSAFSSIDPAPPLPESEEKEHNIAELQKTLLDTSLPLFYRYRAMFALRDLASPPSLPSSVPAVHALAAGFADPSALFRHEIAFVFGQLSHPASIPALIDALANKNEDAMVRHEAAEALGSLGDEKGVEDVLKQFAHDDVQVVRESVVVALDMAEFEKSGQTEYAVLPGMTREDLQPIAA